MIVRARWGCWTACLAIAWLAAREGRAQVPPSSIAASIPAPPVRAAVTLLGPAPEVAAVKEVMGELLARAHVESSWATRTSFAPQHIFERGSEADAAVIAVWIDLSEPEQARLYFRHSGADRFFLRSLLLPQGIDELAKEEIAHIVVNAVLALRGGTGEALTRTQARTALHIPPAPEAGPVPAPASRALRGSVALLLGGQRLADEVPFVAQASALLAVSYRLSRGHTSALGAWARFGYYQFDAEYRADLVAAEVQAMALRGGLLFTSDLSHWLALSLAAGAGAERIHYAPRAGVLGIIPAPSDSFYVPALSLWSGFDVRLMGGLALTLHLCADVLLETVHFDLHNPGATLRVLELHTFRPGIDLGLAYAF